MSGPARPERPPRPERVAGIFIAVTWAAFVFAAFGLLAVVLDRDPIERQVSPFFALVSLGLAMLVVYVGVIATVPRRSPWTGSAATALAVYVMLVLSAAVADLDLAIAQAVSPFVLVAVVLAAVPPLAAWGYFARRR